MIKEIGTFELENDNNLYISVEITNEDYESANSVDIMLGNYGYFQTISLEKKEFLKLMKILKKVEKLIDEDLE